METEVYRALQECWQSLEELHQQVNGSPAEANRTTLQGTTRQLRANLARLEGLLQAPEIGAQSFQSLVTPSNAASEASVGSPDGVQEASLLQRCYQTLGLPLEEISRKSLRQEGSNTDREERQRIEQELAHSRRLLEKIADTSPQMLYIVDLESFANIYVNRQVEEMLGFTAAEVQQQGAQFFGNLIHPEDLAVAEPHLQRLLHSRDGEAFDLEYRARHADGSWRWLQSREVVFGRNAQGEPTQILGMAIDINHRKRIETALRESEARFRSTSEQSAVGICHCDPAGRFLWVNPALCQLLGYTESELLALNFQSITHPADLPRAGADLSGLTWQQPACSLEKRYLRKNGEAVWGQVTLSVVHDDSGNPCYITGIVQDINLWKQAEAELRASLREKDLLLAEVHHRVKNNLQIISSLLELQVNRIQDSVAQEALLSSQNRVIAMGLIHETLYQSGNLSQIEFAQYVRQLVAGLFRIYGTDTALQLSLAVDETFCIPSDLAISLGLILNELVTNALKHGFSRIPMGTLVIGLSCPTPGAYCLIVSHPGDRLPPAFDLERSSSMGLKLVRLLAQRIHGYVTVERGQQTTFKVQFCLPQSSPIRPLR
ncbi:PAS domain S-box protein [Pseudanabaena sp. FACHB-2040]|uniref:sensor histidine kinase n=1 Tax=Pseudanabaena sp. FACHB-2040 TaxID=2692859 RepID=UPI001684FB58|nr:PAS domain S-box protein [Pseudanabaena sp. FACHB-2040]MBD2258809.1 PAS domain S-box protein [Pseudanabaena sp. FACHB-2040]